MSTSHTPEPNVDNVDLVPGTPPVPITVWRTPADATCLIGATLATRLLAAHTRRGDLVYDTTASAIIAQAAATTGRGYRQATKAGRDHGKPATLAVVAWPVADTHEEPDLALAAARRRLSPGGILAVICCPQAGGIDSGAVVDAATTAGLSYLQHIVAVTTAVHDDHLSTDATSTPPAAPHLRVHTDILIFQLLAGAHG